MKLDKNQVSAVLAKEKNILVIAAPGSGKTTVIINRVKYIVDNLKVHPSNIIVITFTKMAGINMKSRYLNAFQKDNSPFFGTFHGLFYKILLREGERINIIEGYKSYKIVEGVLKKYQDQVSEDKIKEGLNNISAFKTSRKNLDDFTPSISINIFKEILESYEGYKRENEYWDFDDLTLRVLELLRDNSILREGYRKLFKYILVDEFQDCDPLQIEFLKLLNGEGNHLFAVGDEDQCIYSFRGAMPEYMVTFNKEFKDSRKYYLTVNYRSKKKVVEFSKGIISFNKERNEKNIEGNKKEEGTVVTYQVSDERQQCQEISKIILSLKEKYRYKDHAVLFRTNAESNTVVEGFIRNKIPFLISDKEYNFFNHFICKDLICYLKVAINSRDRASFLSIVNKPFRYISKTLLTSLKSHKYDEDVFDILMNRKELSSFQIEKVNNLKKAFKFILKSSLGSGIQYIISDMGYLDYLKNYSEKFGGSFQDFEGVVEEFKLSAASYNNILDFLNHIEEVSNKLKESKIDTNSNRVLLSTIHGVKGMEFENVHIINLCEDTIPHASGKENNLEEERRLFYVGVTRAIDNLYLYVPKFRGGNNKKPSQFLREGEVFLLKNKSNIKVGEKVIHKEYGEGIVTELLEDTIRVLFKDGKKRKFSLSIVLQNALLERVGNI